MPKENIIFILFIQESGQQMDKVQKALSEAQMINAKVQSARDSKKESLKAEENKKKSLLKQKDDVSDCAVKLLKTSELMFLKNI